MTFDNLNSPDDETPDWLKNLQAGNNDEDSTSASPLSEEDNQPFQEEDILGNLSAFTESEDISPDEEKTPGWLQNIREKEGTAGLPDLDKLESKDDSDWLENIRSQEEKKITPPNKNEEDDTADFLNRIQSLKENEEPEQTDDDDMNWVKGLEYEEQKVPAFEITTPTPVEEDIVLSEIDPTDSTTIDKANDQWLSNLTSGQDDQTSEFIDEVIPEPLPDSTESSPFVDIPIESEVEASILEETFIAPAEEKQNDEEEISFETTSLPGWLVDLQENSPEVYVPLDQQSEFSPEETTPQQVPESIDDDATLLLDSSDVPDWLSDISPSDDHNIEDSSPLPVAPRPTVSIQESEDIEETEAEDELPSWLNALKPDEFDSEEEIQDEIVTEGQEETYGPLTGLRNLLPAEPDIVHFGTTSNSIAGLDVSDLNLNNAKILHQMVTSEEKSIVVQRKKISAPNPIMRIIIAVVLYLVVFIPTLIDSRSLLFPNPEYSPIEINDAVQEIISLPDDSTVLVAFEYQPGFAGEIEAAASSMVDYLNLKGSKLVTISTQPTGQGLANRFFSQIDILYTSLGYVSGDMAALSNFSHHPQDTIKPLLNNQNNFLSEINNISDFDMILVLTDDADTGRAWVEQVQPQLVEKSIPLLMGMSAQAEPLLSPYYRNEPKQIAGFSSGITGGAYFEQYVKRENIARTYWDSYGAGLSVSILIISISGFYNVSTTWIGMKKKDRK